MSDEPWTARGSRTRDTTSPFTTVKQKALNYNMTNNVVFQPNYRALLDCSTGEFEAYSKGLLPSAVDSIDTMRS